MYRDAVEKLQIWLNHAKEKIPSMKERSLSDKLAIENVLLPLEEILNSKVQGEGLLENVLNRSQIVLPHTSETGRQNIEAEVTQLNSSFRAFFEGRFSL